MARILIVEDNAVNLKLAVELLELEGHVVTGACDADEAIELLRRGAPELILMDIGLPGMDGLALTRRIKSEARLRHVPVIALTAFAMKGDDLNAIAAGCDGYIAKPIDTRRFAGQVADALRRGAS